MTKLSADAQKKVNALFKETKRETEQLTESANDIEACANEFNRRKKPQKNLTSSVPKAATEVAPLAKESKHESEQSPEPVQDFDDIIDEYNVRKSAQQNHISPSAIKVVIGVSVLAAGILFWKSRTAAPSEASVSTLNNNP